MSKEVQDETAGFEVVTSDVPVTEEADNSESEETTQELESIADEGEAGSEDKATIGDNATAEEEASQDENSDKPKRKRNPQKRIDKVVREREDEKRKNESLEARIKELEQGQSKSEPTAAEEPQENDYDSYDEYLDAVDAYEPPAQGSRKQEAESEDSLTSAQRTAMAIVQEKIEGGAEVHADFDKIALDSSVPITGEMIEALAECDDPAKVMMRLGSDKDLAAEIANKSPAQQMRAIAKMDLAVNTKPIKPTRTSKAADPISPVGGSGAQEKNISDMSFSEYEAHMNAKEGRR